MKRILCTVFVLLLSAGVFAAEKTEPVVDPETQGIVSMLQVDHTESFGDWLVETGDQVATAEGNLMSTQKRGGGSCGGTTCGWFLYCCNPSCGTCVPYGWSCTQQSCN